MIDAIRTSRLLLRCWQPEDASLLKEAIDSSLPELQLWVEWTLHHPMPVTALESRLADMREKFAAGDDWAFGIFDAEGTRVLGGAGLHPRRLPRVDHVELANRSGKADLVELGYWVRSDATGQGLAYEAATALCAAAFRHGDVERVDILCDVQNQRSASIPQRLGFTVTETFRQQVRTSRATERDTQRWTLMRPRSVSNDPSAGGTGDRPGK
jgi:RimJ/RimL family protein N-acetyltransferase